MRRLWHTFCAGGIDKADATASPKALFEIDASRHQAGGHPIDKALITRESGKSLSPIDTDVFLIKMLKIAVRVLVEADENRHDFTQTQGAATLTMLQAVAKKRDPPLGFKALAKIIDLAKELL